ncbi:MAG: MFS transporter [Micromonosporaceae bacterium]
MSRRPRLGGRDFGIFWTAETLSTFGASFSLVAVPLLVLDATGSVVQMGLLTGLLGTSNLLTGVFAGVIADRFERRTLLIVCNVAQAVLFGLIPLVWLVATPIWLLYVVVPLAGVFAMVFRVTYVTVIPRLVGPGEITRANGWLSASFAAGGVIGPVCAGVISGQFGPTTAIAVDAVSFAVAAVALRFVRLRAAPAPAEGTTAAGSWRDLLVGARFLWRHPVLRALTILLTVLIFFWQGLVDLIVFYLKHDLSQPDSTVGYVLAVAATGTFIGSLTVARLRRRLGFGAAWIGSTALCGLAIAAIGFTHSVTGIAVLAMVAFGATAIGGICSMSLRQEVTPDALLGRVTSAFWTIHFALGPIGAAVVTMVASRFGVSVAVGLSGAASLVIAACAVLTPVRLARPEHVVSRPRAALSEGG